MRLKFLAAAASAATIVCGGAAFAQSAGSIVVDLSDGTHIVTTPQGGGYLIEMSGGPGGDITVNITSLAYNGNVVSYTGTVTVQGTTTNIACDVNLTTGTISGNQYCQTAFATGSSGGGGSSGGSGGVVSGGFTPSTTGGGTITTSSGPGGTTVYTLTYPDGTVATITAGQATLIRNVEAEQFLLGIAHDARSIEDVQNLIVQRFGQMQAAGIAPGGISLTAGGGYAGRAAGAGGWSPGLWIDGSAAEVQDKRIGAGVRGWDQSITVGADLSSDALTVGGFLTYATRDTDGPDAIANEDGFTGGVYGRWSVMPGVIFTGAAGASGSGLDFSRTVGALTSTGSTDRTSSFALLGVESQFSLGARLLVTPSLTFAYSGSKTDAYTDSNNLPIGGVETDTTLGSLGASFYYTGGMVTPYLALNYNQQLDGPAGVDKSYGVVGAGVIVQAGGGVAVIAGASGLVDKSGETSTGVNVTLRRGF